jgi:hypothetical protein
LGRFFLFTFDVQQELPPVGTGGDENGVSGEAEKGKAGLWRGCGGCGGRRGGSTHGLNGAKDHTEIEIIESGKSVEAGRGIRGRRLRIEDFGLRIEGRII